MKKIINWFKSICNRKIVDKARLTLGLCEEKIIVADVGSTGGLDFRWNKLNGNLFVYSFDPDQRALHAENHLGMVFNAGLWSEKRNMPIFFTKFPPATSIYKPNEIVLNKFLNARCHDVLDQGLISVKTMQEVLDDHLPPDFIKVDAEGADLEILRGAENFLEKTVFGVQVEVQFIERNIGSPMFSDIDSFMRSHGYWLMDLSKQSWIRSSNLWSIESVPQVVWADAVYMLSDIEILKRANNLNNDQAKKFLIKIIAVAMIYGFYDYAYSLVETFLENEYITTDYAEELKIILRKNIQPTYKILLVKLMLIMVALVAVLVTYPISRYRNSAKSFLQMTVAGFLISMYKTFSRHGPNNVAVCDWYPYGW